VPSARIVAGREDQRGGAPALGERDPDPGRRGERGSDAGHDLEADPRPPDGLDLLCESREHPGITILQTDDPPPAAGPIDEQAVDLGLGQTVPGRSLAGVDQLDVGPRVLQQLGGDQAIVDDHRGVAQPAQTLERDQVGLAGPGADERYERQVAHGSASFRPRGEVQQPCHQWRAPREERRSSVERS